jgi:hypothetical protein
MGVLAFVFVFSAIGSQVYRGWKHSDAIQKQQTKWVTYALVVAAILMTAISPLPSEPAAASIGRDFILALVVQLILTGTFLMIVLAILLAILRHRPRY